MSRQEEMSGSRRDNPIFELVSSTVSTSVGNPESTHVWIVFDVA